MAATKTHAVSESKIWSRLVRPDQGGLSAELAKYVLDIDFDEKDHRRMVRLAAKARQGSLTPAEEDEMDAYVRVGDVLALLQSKARMSLRPATKPRSAS